MARLVHLHIFPDVKFIDENLMHIGRIEIQRPRGQILDRNGRILATDRVVFSLNANPSKINDPQALAAELHHRLGMDYALLLDRLSRQDAQGRKMKFVWIKRWLSEGETDRLGDLTQIPQGHALALQKEAVRFYPEGQLASHVLGFANREGQGSEGVELAYDRYLRSVPGRQVSRVDNKRNLLTYLTLEYEPPKGGDDLTLTLDARIQFSLERQLDLAMIDKKAPRAMGLIMDVHTGEILALAVRPAFDPNRYAEHDPEFRKNRALVDVFEPGSAFKIVTASAALELGLITPEDLINCENGSFNPYGHRIKDTHKLGIVPFWRSFAESSNVATIKVAALLGPERFESWITRFGFAQRTGIDLPGESPGIFRPRNQWSRLSMGSLPIGQEIAVTMPQLAQAFAAIANGGFLVQPHVVKKTVSKEGDITYLHEAPPPRQILSAQTAATMRELCYQVVALKEGTGRYAAIREFRAGGKTGTAQIARPDGRGYYKDRFTTIFAGFAPVSEPRIVCVIVVQEPMIDLHFGGYVCGPVFKEIVREALVLLNTPQDPMPDTDAPKAPTTPKPTAPDADALIPRLELRPIEVLAEAEEGLDGLELLPYLGNPTEKAVLLPNLIGLTKRQAKQKLVELGLQWDPQGAGRVVFQDPPPGALAPPASVCRLIFSNAPTTENHAV